ncbi:DNA replication and repair protein recF [Streptococcus pneumoniae]|nr:DNA replication and repair protein recF [Streptococcus pneumoniae]
MQLDERLEQDLQLGYTRIGNHRADIHVHWRSHGSTKLNDALTNEKIDTDVNKALPVLKEQAANVLSRGEKKLLITALRLSQLPLLLNNADSDLSTGHATSQITPVVLLDDITAELDDRAIHILLSTLSKLPCQVFMTSLTDDIVPLVQSLWSTPNVFHVKQDQVFLS